MFPGLNRVYRSRLFIDKYEVLVKATDAVIDENVDIVVAVLILATTV